MRAHCHSAASTATWVAARSASGPNRGRAPVVPSKALPEWIAASWQSVTRLPHRASPAPAHKGDRGRGSPPRSPSRQWSPAPRVPAKAGATPRRWTRTPPARSSRPAISVSTWARPPGVGKTYAMLSEGHRRRSRGTDVVIGFVEAYGRPLTEALINGLEVVPRRGVDYRGSRLEEMDLDAILRRRPEVALV